MKKATMLLVLILVFCNARFVTEEGTLDDKRPCIMKYVAKIKTENGKERLEHLELIQYYERDDESLMERYRTIGISEKDTLEELLKLIEYMYAISK